MEVFLDITNSPTSDHVSVFYNKFNYFEFTFCVVVFNDMCKFVDILFDTSLNIDFCSSQIKHTQTLLTKEMKALWKH